MDFTRLDLQNAEFDTLTELAKQWNILCRIAVVDDDYPSHRMVYEAALANFIDAIRVNGRLAPHLMPVLQPWVCALPMMQQSVLISGVRSPDGLKKDHVAKLLLRWYRRCVLYCSFGHVIMTTPYELGGGSFTGPSIGSADPDWHKSMDSILFRYLQHIDETPLHFHLHFMHACEILGYKHPEAYTREFWQRCYYRIVDDLHLKIENVSDMDIRLGDTFEGWDARNDPHARARNPT